MTTHRKPRWASVRAVLNVVLAAMSITSVWTMEVESGPIRVEIASVRITVTPGNVGYSLAEAVRDNAEDILVEWLLQGYNWGSETWLRSVGLRHVGDILEESESSIVTIDGGVAYFEPNSTAVPTEAELTTIVGASLAGNQLLQALHDKGYAHLTEAKVEFEEVLDEIVDEQVSEELDDEARVQGPLEDEQVSSGSSSLVLPVGAAAGALCLFLLVGIFVHKHRSKEAMWRDGAPHEINVDDFEKPKGLHNRDSLNVICTSSDAGSSRLGRILAVTAVAAVQSLPGPTTRSDTPTPPGSSENDDVEMASAFDGTVSVEPSIIPIMPMESFEHHNHLQLLRKDMIGQDELPVWQNRKVDDGRGFGTLLEPTDVSAGALEGTAVTLGYKRGLPPPGQLAPEGGYKSDDNLTFGDTTAYDPDSEWDPDDASLSATEPPEEAFETSDAASPAEEKELMFGVNGSKSYNFQDIKSPDFKPRRFSFPGVL